LGKRLRCAYRHGARTEAQKIISAPGATAGRFLYALPSSRCQYPRDTADIRGHRNFRFVIPVRNPDRWKQKTIFEPLRDTLSFISEDEYAFEFEKATDPAPLVRYLDFNEDDDAAFRPTKQERGGNS
jgi:hypothetical protein